MKKRYGSGLTAKERRQAQMYHEFMKQQNPKYQAEDLFGLEKHHTRHINKSCSVCGHHWAWHSVDGGDTWQCSEHKK
jgi:hypothetical protein